jgi:hypothetical protein
MCRPSSVKIGARYTRLVVLSGPHKKSTYYVWKCRCDCGAEVSVATSGLRSGGTRSCGCLRRELATTHGDTRSREYSIWHGIINRTRGYQARKQYYDRGIRLCQRWKKYANFLADMGRCPAPGMSLDRKDNDKGYNPANCRWATQVEHAGKTRTLTEWARELGLNEVTLNKRWHAGDRGGRLLRPTQTRDTFHSYQVLIGDRTNTLAGWAREFGILPATLHYRYRVGYRDMQLLRPVQDTGRHA